MVVVANKGEMEDRSYILLTSVRNEAEHIRGTLTSVCSQTVPPKLWIVCINDSTDDTASIVDEEGRKFSFILPLVVHFGGPRSFSNQVLAVREGWKHATGVPSTFIGLLDGDVTFGSKYFENLIARFACDPKLGISSGRHVECLADGTQVSLSVPSYLVMGPNQFFRRECFEEIGGHKPLQWGGQDTLACAMARMKGWNTAAFADLEYKHHRPTGTEGTSVIRARFTEGVRDQKLGMHPVYALAKTLHRANKRPFLFGTLCWLAGYCRAFLLANDPEIPSECRRYFQAMQLRRLRDRSSSA